MTVLIADAYTVALAVLMAMLLSYATLKFAVQVSAARSRSGTRARQRSGSGCALHHRRERVWPDDGRRGDDLLAHAEVAMTTAMERGGNRILFFQAGMTDSMQERLAFENDLRRAMAAGEFELLPLASNLSAAQFRHQNILQTIRSALADADLDARALEIELTESALMTNPEESAGVLKQLRRMGVSIAIDDFGTGYSSLSYLRRFSIDKLKIDRSFIRDLTISRTDESIVRAIVSHCCPPQPAACFEAMLADRTGPRSALVAALSAMVARGTDP